MCSSKSQFKPLYLKNKDVKWVYNYQPRNPAEKKKIEASLMTDQSEWV